MKIVFLNAWNGKIKISLRKFISDHIWTTDVFCFMEADKQFQQNCDDLLIDFEHVECQKNVIGENGCFQSTYINKKMVLMESLSVLNDDHEVGMGLYTKIKLKIPCSILNVHGVALPGNKLDYSKRIRQSREIIEFMKMIDGPKIIGGDFNLEPNTESVKMFEKNGYRNLIKEYNITTTRNHLSWDLYPDKQLFADYVFVSPDIKIKSFEVPDIEISDHLPLILEIE